MEITFEETRENIEYIFNNAHDYVEFFEKYMMDEMGALYNNILSHINMLQNNQGLNEEDVVKIEQMALSMYPYLMNVCILKPLTDAVRLFIMSLNQLIYNWNNNTINNPKITSLSSNITNLLNKQLSMIDMIDILRCLVDRVDKLNTWMPPSIDISKRYFNLIEEQLKKG